MNKGMVRLRQGRLSEGLREYEYRKQTHAYPRRNYAAPKWNGRPMPGKTLLVMPEQGLGDMIQFVRYLPLVKQQSEARILFECQRELIELFSGVDGYDEIVTRTDVFTPPDLPYDAHVSLLSLPFMLGLSNESDITAKIPYIPIDPVRKQQWAERLAGYPGIKVGLRWAGNPEFPADSRRSCRLEDLAPLAMVPGATFISLQQEAIPEAGAGKPGDLNLIDVSRHLTDFADTAALIASLDIVVSTCTSVAHLAGAVGAQVLMALGWDADWRWMQEREDSPWYPQMRLFRQPGLGDWNSVYTRIARQLDLLSNVRHATVLDDSVQIPSRASVAGPGIPIPCRGYS
jgi:hypothetical protein